MSMLTDKVIVITGACGKLGAASMRMFLERGAVVIGTDRIRPEEKPVLADLRAQYDESRLLLDQSDVTDEAQVEKLFALIKERFGRLDGSFHNAYAQLHRPIIEFALEEWENVIRGTLTSTFLVCKHAVKLMLENGGGVVLNSSSILSQKPQAMSSAYGAAKAAINQFTRTLAVEYGQQGIRANCILPGDFKEKETAFKPERIEAMRRLSLIGRSGTSEEIAEFAAFLLSDAASYITGSLQTIDGGYRM